MFLQLDHLNALHPCREYKIHGTKNKHIKKKGGKEL